jgi:hypothetical protein
MAAFGNNQSCSTDPFLINLYKVQNNDKNIIPEAILETACTLFPFWCIARRARCLQSGLLHSFRL